MSHKQTAVLDFGSGKITVLVGTRTASNTLKVIAKGISDYAGFMDGDFVDASTLKDAIQTSVLDAEKSLGKKIKHLYVGVPAEFSFNRCYPLDYFFTSKTRIKQRHITRLFLQNTESSASNTHTIINKVPVYYTLDDGIKITDTPINVLTTSLHAYTSFIYVDNDFINTISNALIQIGINGYEFVSSSLAQGLSLLTSDVRRDTAVLIDCGYITTSVVHILNDSVVDIKSFSIGGGHITSDISTVLKIPFNSAEELKRKIVLSLNATPSDYYDVVVDNKIVKQNAKFVNDIVLARIDMIADAILTSLSDFANEVKPSVTVYLTGGGISYIKGIREYLKSYLSTDVSIITPEPLQYSKPDLSSEIALLDVATQL